MSENSTRASASSGIASRSRSWHSLGPYNGRRCSNCQLEDKHNHLGATFEARSSLTASVARLAIVRHRLHKPAVMHQLTSLAQRIPCRSWTLQALSVIRPSKNRRNHPKSIYKSSRFIHCFINLPAQPGVRRQSMDLHREAVPFAWRSRESAARTSVWPVDHAATPQKPHRRRP